LRYVRTRCKGVCHGVRMSSTDLLGDIISLRTECYDVTQRHLGWGLVGLTIVGIAVRGTSKLVVRAAAVVINFLLAHLIFVIERINACCNWVRCSAALSVRGA
jgi:hypothetical protein